MQKLVDNKQILSCQQVLSLNNKVKQSERQNTKDYSINLASGANEKIKCEHRMKGYTNEDQAQLSAQDQTLMNKALSNSEQIYIQARKNINKFLSNVGGINHL